MGYLIPSAPLVTEVSPHSVPVGTPDEVRESRSLILMSQTKHTNSGPGSFRALP